MKYEVLGMPLVLEESLDSQDLLREAIPAHREVPGEVRKAGNQENNQKIPGMTLIQVLDIPQKFYHKLMAPSCVLNLRGFFPLLLFP